MSFEKGGIILRNDGTMLKYVSGPRAMQLAAIGFILSLLFLPTVSPAAVSLSGDSSTYLQSREAADSSKILGAYEYLDFAVQNIGNETISFHTGGWLRYDLQTEQYGKKSNSDLQYSYLSIKSKTDNAIVNLGRVMVFEGVATERVDGVYARTDLRGGFGISAYGGSPVETNIDLPGNNIIYGGRLSHKLGDLYQIGISALKEEKNSADYRKEEGIDIWVHPFSKVDITGRSSYNEITKGWMEHTYLLLLGPFKNLRFDTTASWINYNDYFFQTTTNALSVTNGLITKDEKVQILGEAASWGVTDKVLITVDYKNFDYTIQGKANYYGGTVKYSQADKGGAGIGYHRMDGDTDRLKYDEYRLYGYKKIGKLDVTADLLDVTYASAINGVKDSYSVALAAQYDITEAWKLGADVEYSHNPDFDKDIRTFFKLLYHFGSKGGA
jgi:hypothetical protein